MDNIFKPYNPKDAPTPSDFKDVVRVGLDVGLEVWRDSIGTYSYRTITPRGCPRTVMTCEQLWQDIIDEGLKKPLPPITLLQLSTGTSFVLQNKRS